MESWYKVALSERDISDGKGVSLQGEFAGLFVASGGPRDAAMFDYVDNKPSYICFFSPGAFQIAEILLRQYGAIDKEQ